MNRRDVKKGLKVRRAGNPRTAVGRARKAQVFTITTIYGDFRGPGFSRAKLEGEGQSFWVSNVEGWETADAD